MKVLIDMNLSMKWVPVFKQYGWRAVHWRNIGEPHASDSTIMAWARENGYVVFTQDLDFGTLLATTYVQKPSVIQVRIQNALPKNLGPWLVGILQQHQASLESGALLTVTEDRTRVRILPFKLDNS